MKNAPRKLTTIYPLTDNRLLLARLTWAAVFVLTLIVVVVAIPVRFNQYEMGTFGQGTLDIIVDYQALNISQFAIAIYFTALDILLLLMFFGLSLIIFVRNNRDGMALFVSGGMVTVGVFFTAINWSLSNESPVFVVLTQLPSWIGSCCFFIFLLIFPDGKFVPNWTKWIVIPYGLYELYRNILIKLMPANLMGVNEEYFIFLCFLFIGIFAQIMRYRHHSRPIEQQQTKWVVLGITIQIVSLFILLGIQAFVDGNSISLGAKAILGLVVSPLLYNTFAFVTLTALGFAIFRYRLWDVDVVINRSLVYGATALLVITLFFSIVLLIQISIGNTQPLVAFIIAAVFSALFYQYVRKTVQHLVDRYIYGLRYNLNQFHKAQQIVTIANPGVLTGVQLGEYELRSVIGRGGMGEIYEGIGNGQRVAVKVMLPEAANDMQLRTRFQREVEAGEVLRHPNIVHVLGSGEYETLPYLIMEFVEGRDLGAMLDKGKIFDKETAIQIILDICSALEVAHKNGYVHRDIKPDNIMLRKNGKAILMDFGISKVVNAKTITDTGFIGTVYYMAPEQIKAAKDVDQRADIYALACVLYQMLTKQPPFAGTTLQVIFGHVHQPAPDPREVQENILDDLADTILKALEKDPDKRFSSVSEFAAALQN